MTRLHASIAAIFAALTLLAIPAASPAATYTISQCDARTGAALPGWTTLTNGTWKATSTCPKNLNFTANGSGKYAVLRTPALPAELGIARVSFLAAGLRSKGARPEGGFCKTYPARSLCKRQVTRRAAKRSRAPHSNEFVWHQHGETPGARAFEIGVRSTSGQSTTSTAYLNARHFKFTINDSTSPTLTVNKSTVPGGWANGTFDVSVAATDGGGGVAGFWLAANGSADGAATRHKATSCDYTRWQPCPANASTSFTVNTADFDAGVATLNFTSEDAAGNRSSVASVTFTVDNTPPPTPGAVTYTGGGCSSAALSWSYPVTSDAGSPYVAVKLTFALWDWSYPVDVQLNDMQTAPPWILPIGSTSDETGLVSIDGIANLRLPTIHPNENYYAAFVQIVDQAGNASPPSLFYINSDGCPS